MPRIRRLADSKDELFIPILNTELDALWRETQRRKKIDSVVKTKRFDNITITSTGIALKHGFGAKPSEVSVMIKGQATWWAHKSPDNMNIYLKTDTDVEADVVIRL